ncbi:LysR family transcriptional regulator, partial [Burkholderia pseudomallei]
RMGVPPFFSELALEGRIDRLRDAFPRLTLRITAGWSPALLENVERAVLDASAVMMPASLPKPDTLESKLIGVQPTVI